MLSAQNRVVGVSSTAFYDDFISQYDNTSLAWNWLKTIACPTFDPTRDMVNFCNDPMCPCGSDEGDCDNDAQCSGSLTCHHDVGNLVGLPASLDVCAPRVPRLRSEPAGRGLLQRSVLPVHPGSGRLRRQLAMQGIADLRHQQRPGVRATRRLGGLRAEHGLRKPEPRGLRAVRRRRQDLR